jgi:hypothetical protein
MLINFHFHKFQKMILGTFNVLQCVQVLQNYNWVQWRWMNVWRNHYEKKGVLQLALQLNFWVVEYTCNSFYLYTMSANGQVAWIIKLQVTIYIMQLNCNLVKTTCFQLLCNSIITINSTHDVMLMSLIVIHLLKSNMWHYEDFWTQFFFEYWSPSSIMIVNDGPRLWHVTFLLFFPHGILIIFWKKK